MQIKFITAYGMYTNPAVAQKNLLDQWANCCENCQIKFIEKATVTFTTYGLLEYPDQARLKKEYTAYIADFNSDLTDEKVNYCLKEFAKDYKLMELVITVEAM